MKRKVQHLFSALTFAGFIFIAFGSGDDVKDDASIEALANESISSTTQDKTESIPDQITYLKREIISIDKGVDFSSYRSTVEATQLELVLFAAWAKTINEALTSHNSEVRTLGKELENKVKNIQIKEFPILRKAYQKAIYQKLWEENIETEVIGKKYKTIQFTGGYFANNGNKAQTQEALSEALKMFRFTKVNYKWYKYDDEYTYYEMDSPNDSELMSFK
ncbi:hypothetical protein SAMN05444397_102371 [Flavobacterium aquidurense]|uniref:SPOR domain-containing protein n=1 Tax=Flavobacterium frigidimaris TaxID=262320 RepID=A0ABX4BRK5_FLAFR|nr:hypothetical protein [Flavobacterium frigidimaris]OXA79130.1 hypothetical protein B0A65_11325 [Flavobacterium frigidimaris]SDY83285.1 hypothetical protein SAMN05444397_102371 [Flavobacterium aquidurense]